MDTLTITPAADPTVTPEDADASALEFYRFARFVQGLSVEESRARVSRIFGWTLEETGPRIGRAVGRRDASRS